MNTVETIKFNEPFHASYCMNLYFTELLRLSVYSFTYKILVLCPYKVLDICFDWAGQRMATASSDCSARVYDVKSDFKELAVMKGHRGEVSKVGH